jgi:hypothetical protein
VRTGPVYVACTKQADDIIYPDDLVQAALSRQDNWNRTPREIYNYINKRSRDFNPLQFTYTE